MRKKKVLAWHFVRDNRPLGYDATGLEPGYVNIWKAGLHGSLTVFDALQHATSPCLCRVSMWGAIQQEDNKLLATHRQVLASKDVSSELRLWGCWCVRQVWHLLTDERSRKAVETAEAYAVGKATSQELKAAGAVAWDAARTVSGTVTWAAAGAAAGVATWETARAVSGVATWAAAGAEAWTTARAIQKTELERRMLDLLG